MELFLGAHKFKPLWRIQPAVFMNWSSLLSGAFYVTPILFGAKIYHGYWFLFVWHSFPCCLIFLTSCILMLEMYTSRPKHIIIYSRQVSFACKNRVGGWRFGSAAPVPAWKVQGQAFDTSTKRNNKNRIGSLFSVFTLDIFGLKYNLLFVFSTFPLVCLLFSFSALNLDFFFLKQGLITHLGWPWTHCVSLHSPHWQSCLASLWLYFLIILFFPILV